MKSINAREMTTHPRSGSLIRPNDVLVQALAAAALTITTATAEIDRQDGELVKVTSETGRQVPIPHAEKAAANPEDELLLLEIDQDLDASLEHCSSCSNLMAIPRILLRLPVGEPVSVEKLREASKGCVSEELYASVDRSLTILESHPHLSLRASELAQQKLDALGAMDLRRPPLLALLSLCRKQTLEQQSLDKQRVIAKQ